MTAWLRLRFLTAAILVSVSLIFAFAPAHWIEFCLGVDPDGGSGLTEILYVVLPLAAGIGVGMSAFGNYRRRRFLGGAASAGDRD